MPDIARIKSKRLYLDCPDPDSMDLEQLLFWHQQGLKQWRQRSSATSPLQTGYSWLVIKQKLAHRLLTQCNLCVHDCRVDRIQGERGYCQLDAEIRISGSYLHWGEEAPISPTWAVFFSGCTMHCVYCHNWRETFDLKAGRVVDAQQLAQDLETHQGQYQTISFIGGTPEPQLHGILDLALALPDTVQAPLVFNSNATLSQIGLELMEGVIDIYLPDFKHGNQACAWQLTKIDNYLQSMDTNLKAYRAQRAGVLVRHLVIPGHLECCTHPILTRLAQDYPEFSVNVMFQYRPMYQAANKPLINRSLSEDEEAQVKQWIQELGVKVLK